MNDFFSQSVFFGVMISLLAYGIGTFLKAKLKWPIFNPLLISILLVMLFLTVTHVSYDVYYESAKYLSYLLTPATVALAIPLYEKFQLLKQNWKALIAGILSGVLTSMLCIFVLALLLGLSHEHYVTLLPKSITTAIGMDLSEEFGGYVSLTVAVIMITGIFGNMISDTVFRLFKINDPIAQGIALGSSAHVIGTSKAMEMGEVQGAMSSLAIVVSGILTVIIASFFAPLL